MKNQYGENDPSAKQVGAGDDSMVPCEVCGQPGHWPSKHANDLARAQEYIAELEKERDEALAKYNASQKDVGLLSAQFDEARAEVEKHRLEIQALEDQVVDFSAEVEKLKKERERTASIVDAWWNING